MEDAKKNIAVKKAPNARFFQGGKTGLVQQKGRIRASSTFRKPGIKKEIKIYDQIGMILQQYKYICQEQKC